MDHEEWFNGERDLCRSIAGADLSLLHQQKFKKHIRALQGLTSLVRSTLLSGPLVRVGIIDQIL